MPDEKEMDEAFQLQAMFVAQDSADEAALPPTTTRLGPSRETIVRAMTTVLLMVFTACAWVVWVSARGDMWWAAALWWGMLGVLAISLLSLFCYAVFGSEEEAEARALARIVDKEFKASRRLRSKLGANEELWWAHRQHLIVLARWHAPSVLVAVAGLWLLPLTQAVYVGLGLALLNAYPLLDWARRWYGFTDSRILMTEGVIASTAPSMPLVNSQEWEERIPWWSVLLARLRFIRTRVGTIDPQSNVPDAKLKEVTLVPDVRVIMRLAYDRAEALKES